MANARELKNKIRSVNNTKKITRTMEMISTAKAVVCQKRIEQSQPYGDKLNEILKDLGGAGGDAESGEFPLLRKPETVRREALFVVTANRGLCGGYNTNVLKRAEQFIAEKKKEGIEVDVYILGKKGIARFRYLGMEVAGTFTQFEDKPTFEEAEEGRGKVLESVDDSFFELHVARRDPFAELLVALVESVGPATDNEALIRQLRADDRHVVLDAVGLSRRLVVLRDATAGNNPAEVIHALECSVERLAADVIKILRIKRDDEHRLRSICVFV